MNLPWTTKLTSGGAEVWTRVWWSLETKLLILGGAPLPSSLWNAPCGAGIVLGSGPGLPLALFGALLCPSLPVNYSFLQHHFVSVVCSWVLVFFLISREARFLWVQFTMAAPGRDVTAIPSLEHLWSGGMSGRALAKRWRGSSCGQCQDRALLRVPRGCGSPYSPSILARAPPLLPPSLPGGQKPWGIWAFRQGWAQLASVGSGSRTGFGGRGESRSCGQGRCHAGWWQQKVQAAWSCEKCENQEQCQGSSLSEHAQGICPPGSLPLSSLLPRDLQAGLQPQIWASHANHCGTIYGAFRCQALCLSKNVYKCKLFTCIFSIHTTLCEIQMIIISSVQLWHKHSERLTSTAPSELLSGRVRIQTHTCVMSELTGVFSTAYHKLMKPQLQNSHLRGSLPRHWKVLAMCSCAHMFFKNLPNKKINCKTDRFP